METVSNREAPETIFISWSFKMDLYTRPVDWDTNFHLEAFNKSYLYFFETSLGDIIMYFNSPMKVQSWSTKVLVRDRNGKCRHEQKSKVCGFENCSYEIWKMEKKILCESVVDGFITFNIFITDLTVSAFHKGTFEEKCIQTFRRDDVPCLDSLSLDLCSLMEDGSTSDVVLKSGNNEFSAHRALLSSRSEVFSAMFRSDMREKREGFVEITDIDPSDLRHLLKYIYSGKVDDLTEELARRLYVVADKYAVHPLKKKCEAFLGEMLTDENVCSTLILADTYNGPDFKDFIIDYIIQRDDILNTEEWSRMADMHPKLGVEMYKAYFRKSKAVSNV